VAEFAVNVVLFAVRDVLPLAFVSWVPFKVVVNVVVVVKDDAADTGKQSFHKCTSVPRPTVAKQYVLVLLLVLLLFVVAVVSPPLLPPHGTSDTPDNGAAHSLLAVLAES
jgi:hypothetical protein